MELLARVEAHARATPDAAAAREVGLGCDACLTYGALWRGALAVGAAVRARIAPGDVVILVTGNRVEYFIACLGIWAAGCVVMPMHPSVAEKELEEAARRTNAKLAMLDTRYVARGVKGRDGLRIEELGGFVRSALDDGGRGGEWASAGMAVGQAPGLLLQSSGTTGLPKIARRTRDAVDAVARNVARAAGLTSEDRVFGAAPICHAYGIENGFLAPLWAGCAVHLCDGLDLPVAMAQFAGACTVFPGVPFMFEVLARSVGPVARNGSLRLTYSAGGMLPASVAGTFERAFGLRVGQLYGASELGSVTFNHPHKPAADPLSVGYPMEGVDVRILDQDCEDPERVLERGREGVVAIKAASMMSGYVDSEAALIGGYFLTGDLGRLSAQGDLTITGRLKNLIDIGGMKVNPAEVEGVLKGHPLVAECVVVPVPITPTVSRLKAVVVLAAGGEGIDGEELRRFARERLAGYKVPRVVEVRASLPRSASGKVLRAQLEVSG